MQEDTYMGTQYDPLSLNLYTYCENNPIKYYDPTGHSANGVNFGPNEGADWLRTGSGLSFEDYWGCGPYGAPLTTTTTPTTTPTTTTPKGSTSPTTGTSSVPSGTNGVNFGPNEGADWMRSGTGLSFEEYWGCGPYGTPSTISYLKESNDVNPKNSYPSSIQGIITVPEPQTKIYKDSDWMVTGKRFTSVDMAARDWAYNYYGASYYVAFECVSLIYIATDQNGDLYYSYTYGIWGEPHSVKPWDAIDFVPKDATVIAVIHSHPNSTNFSKSDKDFAERKKISIYVAVPGTGGVTIKRWAAIAENDKDINPAYKEKTIVTNMSIAPLSKELEKYLENKFKHLWDKHCKDGCAFDCENKAWPRK